MDQVTIPGDHLIGPDMYYIRIKWLQLGLNIILFAISCFGNVLTLISVLTNHALRKKRNVLIVSLAVSDITSLAAYLVSTTHVPSDDYFRTANFNLDFTLVTTTVFISIAHIVVIGLERIIAITRPLHYPRIVTNKTIAIMVLAVWVIPIVSIIPGYLYAIGNPETTGQILHTAHYSVCTAAYFALSITMFLMYGKILRDATLQANKVHQMTTQFVKVTKRPEKKALKLVISILVCFTLSYLPYALFCILTLSLVDASGYESSMELFEVVAIFFVQVNSTVNAGVYAAFSREFRQAYVKILCFCNVQAPKEQKDHDVTVYSIQ